MGKLHVLAAQNVTPINQQQEVKLSAFPPQVPNRYLHLRLQLLYHPGLNFHGARWNPEQIDTAEKAEVVAKKTPGV